MIEGRLKHCWRRLRRHHFIPGIERGDHIWKVCSDCGAMRMTHHVSCSTSCWAGPA